MKGGPVLVGAWVLATLGILTALVVTVGEGPGWWFAAGLALALLYVVLAGVVARRGLKRGDGEDELIICTTCSGVGWLDEAVDGKCPGCLGDVVPECPDCHGDGVVTRPTDELITKHDTGG